MRSIDVYDPALCCSSGVCGADVDQNLVDFQSVVQQVEREGISVTRHNLATDPLDFAQSEAVRKFLEISGADALPAVVVDGVVAMSGSYPDANMLRTFAGAVRAPVGVAQLNVTSQASGCCGDGGGCC